MEIAASAWARLPIAARWVTHGPTPWSLWRGGATGGPSGRGQPVQPHGDVEREGMLGITRVRLRPGRVARLPLRDHVDQPVDDRRMRPVGAVVPRVQGDDLAGQGLGRAGG